MEHGLQEIEWQYDAPGGLEGIEEWLLGGPRQSVLTVLDGGERELEDTYYDTKDRLLRRAGCALRLRRKMTGHSEVTIKSLTPAMGNRHERREVSESLEVGGVEAVYGGPGPVGVRLRALLSGSQVVSPLFRVHTRRRTFKLLLDGSNGEAIQAGEVALDDAEIPLEGETVRLARVEVEVAASVPGVVSILEDFAKVMERTLGLLPAAVSKYEAGLRATGGGVEEQPRSEPG